MRLGCVFVIIRCGIVIVLALGVGRDAGSVSGSMPVERPGAIEQEGIPLTLIGLEIKEGSRAPEFAAVDTELRERRLSEFLGKVVVINGVTSLDTPVCDVQTRRFNQEV